jgi:cytochrome c
MTRRMLDVLGGMLCGAFAAGLLMAVTQRQDASRLSETETVRGVVAPGPAMGAGRRWAETLAAIMCAGLAIAAVVYVMQAGSADSRRLDDTVAALTGGDPSRGQAVITEIGCGGCHEIPGLPGAHGRVGPSLARFGQRTFVGGVAPNTPDNLIRWIQDPPSLSPNTAMPVLGLDRAAAQDVAAWLYRNTS